MRYHGAEGRGGKGYADKEQAGQGGVPDEARSEAEGADDGRRAEVHETRGAGVDDGDVGVACEEFVGAIVFLEDAKGEGEAWSLLGMETFIGGGG